MDQDECRRRGCTRWPAYWINGAAPDEGTCSNHTPKRYRTKPKYHHDGPVVYFLRDHEEPIVKIGTTTNLNNRFRKSAGTILGYVPGSYDLERELHERFKADRLTGTEWFHETPDLMSYIEQVIA
jgi:hypothetical protein